MRTTPSPDLRPAQRELEQVAMAWPPAVTPELAHAEPGGQGIGSWRDVLETIVLTVVIAAGIQFAVQSRLVEGSSMEPTLHDGQRLLINRLSYLSPTEPQRGDVVVFTAWDGRDDYIKRVVGVPGDVIEIRGREIVVNGSVLDEPYLDGSIDYGQIGPVVMDPEHYYVLGDNRSNSSDSRLHGPLPREQIIGKAWVSFWPPADLGLIRGSTSFAAAEQ